MLPKNKRVPRELFKAFLDQKRSFGSKHFVLHMAPFKSARVAVSVSKKISKSAVVRNKIRRRVYTTINRLSPLPDGLFLLIAKSGIDKLKDPELTKELADLFKKE